MNDFKTVLFENGAVMEWGKDEDGDDLIVFYSWTGLKQFGEAVVAALDAQDLIVDGEVFLKENHDTRTTIKLVADKADLAKVAAALDAMFESTRFAKCIDEVFDTDCDGDDAGLQQCEMLVDRLIDKAGVEMGFEDSYARCNECGVLVYTEANGYGDHGRFRRTDDGLVCRDCDKKNPEAYLDDYLSDLGHGKIRGFELDPPADFKQVGAVETFMGKACFEALKFERGLHRGQCDNPVTQLEFLREHGIDDVLFDISTGQFDVSWTLWVRADQVDAAYKLLSEASLADAKGPGDYAEEGLRKAAELMTSEPGKIAVTHIDTSTGDATVQHLTPQEFIDGKAKPR